MPGFAGNGKVQKEVKVEKSVVNLNTKHDASVQSLSVLSSECCRLLTPIVFLSASLQRLQLLLALYKDSQEGELSPHQF